jgi:hypothetical protein
MAVHVRLARPVINLARTETMYRQGFSWVRLGYFEDHEGFDGVMLGMLNEAFHLEFTCRRSHPIKPTPTPEDLLVIYLPERAEWEQRCAALLGAGFREVEPINPYWSREGRSFQDHDGYGIVIQGASWCPESDA